MKISKANFIVISITMITILILFQFSNLSAIYTSQAMKNKNAEQNITITENDTIQAQNLFSSASYSTALIGSKSNRETNIAQEWCIYTKRTFCRFPSLASFSDSISSDCKLLIVNEYAIDTEEDISILTQASKMGIHIIFTSLPDTSLLHSSKELLNLTGISQIRSDSYQTNGMTVFDGFLLGGKTTYHNLKKTVPYFLLASGTKTYISGTVKHQKKKEIKNEELPPIVWRNHYENSFVFSVNCDFFEDHTGLGILTAMLSETANYTIYPIVNAQSIICQNFPYLSNENSTEISKHYFYTSKALCENVLWPDIVSILSATDDKFSGMIAPKLEYSGPGNVNKDALSFYFKQTEKISGELGISGDQLESKSFYEEKLTYDTALFRELAAEYTFTVFSPGNMPESIYEKYLNTDKQDSILSDIRTLILPKEQEQKPILFFYNNDIIALANTINGFSHTDEEDLYLRSIETALGYSAVSLDFSHVIYPTGKGDDWTQLSKDVSRYLDTYWQSFRKAFSQVTVSEADQKAREFFALSYTSYRRSNTINLSITNFHTEAAFLLDLTDERIISISGGTYVQAEKGKYVITAKQKDVSIKVADDFIE